jgi:AhpC/TSA family
MRAIGKLIVLGAVMWLICVPATLLAIDPLPMPDFQLSSLDGQSVKSSDLPSSGSWLIVYIQPTSHYCDQLVKSLTKERFPNLATHTVFIVGGTVEDAKAAKAKYDELSTASWYADPSRTAFSQLKLHGVPVVLGVRDKTIQWSLNGILSDDKVFQSILNSWIQK